MWLKMTTNKNVDQDWMAFVEQSIKCFICTAPIGSHKLCSSSNGRGLLYYLARELGIILILVDHTVFFGGKLFILAFRLFMFLEHCSYGVAANSLEVFLDIVSCLKLFQSIFLGDLCELDRKSVV